MKVHSLLHNQENYGYNEEMKPEQSLPGSKLYECPVALPAPALNSHTDTLAAVAQLTSSLTKCITMQPCNL
eukprot:1158137-Pelagomonas_calceolata.AAC.2